MSDNREPGAPEVISHYEVGERIGGGAMGTVYRGSDRRDGSPVAIKLMNPALSADPEFRERFEREAHVAALMRSPYVARILDYGEEDGRYFLVMEYVDGRSVREALDLGPLPVERALRIAAQTARALEEAEARGIVHRDIKPDNILMREGDSVKVSDFGIARQLGGGGLTMAGAIVGTMAYAAPEVGRGETDHRADIYSLGATLYHCLAGAPPFSGEPLDVLRQHAEKAIPLEPLSHVPAGVVRIIERCMEKDPSQRYQRASELAGALEQALLAVRTGAADDSTVVRPRDDYAATRVAGAEAAATVAAGSRHGESPPLVLVLGPERPGALGGRMGSSRFTVSVRNDGDAPAEVALDAIDPEGACRFTLPARLTVGAGQTARTVLRVRPRSRRMAGSGRIVTFTVSASGGAGQPPVTANGQFEDMPFGLVPVGGAALGIGGVAAAAFLVFGGGSDGTPGVGDGNGPQATDAGPGVVDPATGSSSVYVEYILDASGSMEEPLDDSTRWEIALDVLSERLQALPSDINAGLRAYGHRIPFDAEGACEDTEQVVPVQQDGVSAILDELPSLVPQGMTPISESLRQAADDFTLEEGRKNVIVLLSDGEETCGGEPADAVRFLQEVGIDFHIHVIGLDVDENARRQLKAIADTAGGVYHDARSEQDLRDALNDINTRVAEPAATAAPPGGQMVVDATSEGAVEVSSTYEGFPAGLAVDGDRTTSWFSAGPGSAGAPSFYTWTAARDELITEVTIVGNGEHSNPDFRTGFGFESAIVAILDADGQAVFEQDVSLEGTPDPTVTVTPGVVGRSVRLVLSGHEDPECGGFSELIVRVAR